MDTGIIQRRVAHALSWLGLARCVVCKAAPPSFHRLCDECYASITLAPKYSCSVCGEPLGFTYEVETIDSYRCGSCEDEEPPFTAMRYSYPYDGPIRAMTLKFKYEQERSLGVPLARLAEERLGEWLDLIAEGGGGVMIPVPLAVERLYARGFNPSYLIALEWGGRRGIPVAEGALRRIKNTTPQFGLNAQQRATNVRGAFKLAEQGAVKGKKVILVDDIYTTGATIAECCKAIKKGKPAGIYVATLCRAGA